MTDTTKKSHGQVPTIERLKKTAEKFQYTLPKTSVKKTCVELQKIFVNEFGKENVAECLICKYSGPEFNRDATPVDECLFCGTIFDDGKHDVETTPPTPPKQKGQKKTKDDLVNEMGKKAGTKVKKTKPVKKKKVSAALSVLKEKQEERTDERDKRLQKHLDSIKTLSKNMGRGFYLIGKELIVIRDENLWHGRGFTSMQDYVEKELDISRQLAHKYMVCSAPGGLSQDDCEEIGIKKAELVVTAPDEIRKKLLKSAKTKTYKDLVTLRNKLLGKHSKDNDDVKVTLSTQMEAGRIEIPWLSAETDEPMLEEEDGEVYALIQLTNTMEIKMTPNAFGTGVDVYFQKIGKKKKDDEQKESTESTLYNRVANASESEDVFLEEGKQVNINGESEGEQIDSSEDLDGEGEGEEVLEGEGEGEGEGEEVLEGEGEGEGEEVFEGEGEGDLDLNTPETDEIRM